MKTITLQILIHRGHECIGIFFKQDTELNTIVKTIQHIKFSKTHSCWYLPLSRTNYTNLMDTLKGVANIDNIGLKDYLVKRNVLITTSKKTEKEDVITKPLKKTQINIIENISLENAAELKKFTDHLVMKAYSPSTVKTYRSEFIQLLQLLKNKSVLELSADQLKQYIVYAIKHQKISENTAHSRLNALKFYFEQVLRKEKFFLEIPRPKKPQQLPKLLNEIEIKRLFNALTNKKHKAMLFTTYSAGLRVSEVVDLKLSTSVNTQN